MFKLKNIYASYLFSKTMNDLINDSSRQFPVEDAFKIIDIINVVRSRITVYNEQVLKIAEEHNGIKNKHNSGFKFESLRDRTEATAKIHRLNEIEVEYPGELLKSTKNWPNLTLAEMSILSNIIDK